MADNEILRDAQAKLMQGNVDALRDEAHSAGKQSLLQTGIRKVASLATSDEDVQREIAHYTAAGLKTGALFFGGRVGMAATVGLYGADEIDPRTSAGTMMLDGTLGVAKGAAMKTLFNHIGDTSLNPTVKALGLGVGARLTDNLMSRSSYLDANGNFAPGQGLANTFASSFDKHAIGTDLVTFGLSYGAFRGADALSGRALSNSKVLSTAFLGGSYGFISGANEEVRNQIRQGNIDPTMIALRGLAMGAVDAVAAVPGGLQGAPKQRVETEQKVEKKVEPASTQPPAVPKLELSEAQIGRVREAAKANGFWLMETPKVELAKDGTPVVMPERMNFQQAAVAVSRLAGDLQHAVTMEWNSVRFRVEPNMKPGEIELARHAAENAPERLEMYRRINAEQEAARVQENARAERAIEALRGKPFRETQSLLQTLHTEASYMGGEFVAHGMGSLRHPTEILNFARAYMRFDPEVAPANLRNASRYAQPGTGKVWSQVAEQVIKEGPTRSTPAETALFGQIREFQNMKHSATEHNLWLRTFDQHGVVVSPQGPASISEAGAAAGKFAEHLQRDITLDFNGKLINVRPKATGPEVEALWSQLRN